MKTTIAIYTFFCQSVSEGTVAPFEIKTIQDLPSLNLSCHYFSRVTDGTNRMVDKKVDPKGMLAKAQRKSELYHNISNVVGYFKRNGEDREAG